MPHLYKLSGVVQSTGEKIQLVGEFPDEAWDLLLGFKQEVDKLISVLMKCDSLQCIATLKWDHQTGISAEIKESPSDRDIDVILHNIRPFILKKERFQFNKVLNTLQRYMAHELIERSTRPLKDIYSGRNFQSQIRIYSGDIFINCEKTLHAWLNGIQYHRDQTHQDLITRLDSRFPAGMSRTIFVGMLLDKLKAILSVHARIAALEKKEGTEFTLPLAPARHSIGKEIATQDLL